MAYRSLQNAFVWGVALAFAALVPISVVMSARRAPEGAGTCAEGCGCPSNSCAIPCRNCCDPGTCSYTMKAPPFKAPK